MLILGIESSCDETGVALISDKEGLLADALHTQIDMHRAYGGVVPELASRDHIRRAVALADEVLAKAGKRREDLDGIAVTEGPGLAGALLVGASVAHAIAWALEIPGEAEFAGFVGLGIPSFRTEWREILWRLDPAFWHRGFATEAAEKVLEAAFETYDFQEVVAFTSYWNVPSIRLMRRLGMKRDWAGDFNHPALPITHPLARHCLFRMSRRRWSSQFDDF